MGNKKLSVNFSESEEEIKAKKLKIEVDKKINKNFHSLAELYFSLTGFDKNEGKTS